MFSKNSKTLPMYTAKMYVNPEIITISTTN